MAILFRRVLWPPSLKSRRNPGLSGGSFPGMSIWSGFVRLYREQRNRHAPPTSTTAPIVSGVTRLVTERASVRRVSED